MIRPFFMKFINVVLTISKSFVIISIISKRHYYEMGNKPCLDSDL